ncbi:MAG: VCBS repeat-containing protein [Candidatus Sumerlaeaceae bacterium]|nr:VCBS repeat-containing protein [Candidatus Sumerlaeaceae bacterium]
MSPKTRCLLLAIPLLLISGLQPRAEFVRSAINLPASTSALRTDYDFDGDGRFDVLVVFQRRILIFLQKADSTFPTAPDVEIGSGNPIPKEYAAVAAGKVVSAKGTQLLLVGPNGVDYLTMAQMTGQTNEPVEPKSLIQRPFDLTAGPYLEFLDAALDFDRNGRTDILLPNSDQLEIYKPGAEGRFAQAGKVYLPQQSAQRTAMRGEPTILGASFLGESDPVSLVQTTPRLDRWYGLQFGTESYSDAFLVTDYNLDGRLDLLTKSRVFYQNEAGGFDGTQSDVFDQIATSYGVQSRHLVAAPNLVDFNADGILDTFSVQTMPSKTNPRTDVSVFLGKPDRTFPKEPSFVLKTRDLTYSDLLPLGDVNGDGCIDIALIHLDFQASSPSSQLKAYLRNGLDAQLCFYLWDKKKNRFNEVYDFNQSLLLSYDIYGARQLFQQQIVMNTDMDGDGKPDLVLKSGAEEISIFRNQGGIKGFTSKPEQKLSTSPTKFSSLRVQDLNGDKRGDVVVNGYVDDQEDRVIYSFFVSR